jgi:glycosyltransferase involved in cell wall biosynthesis
LANTAILGPKVIFLRTLPHVFVDATSIPRNRGGVGRYLEGLVPELDAAGLRMTIAVQPHAQEWMETTAPAAHVVVPKTKVASRPIRFLWEQFGLPAAARRARADVIFSPHYTMPLAARRPVVVALYDATFFTHPELHGRIKRVFFRRWIRTSLARATLCVLPSEATRSELERLVGADRARVRVAHLGVDTQIFHAPSADERESARELVGSSAWIAFLGTLEPRKNVANLVAAFDEVVRMPDISRRFPDLRLALAGGKGWDATIDAAIGRASSKDRVRVLGFVPNEELAGLLGGSLLTAYPSLGEGFGLPVVEAMACGSPILTTRFLSLPEVGGDVAAYSEPDEQSLAAALRALLIDDADRALRARRGLERAAEFSGANCASAHIDVFEAAAAT